MPRYEDWRTQPTQPYRPRTSVSLHLVPIIQPVARHLNRNSACIAMNIAVFCAAITIRISCGSPHCSYSRMGGPAGVLCPVLRVRHAGLIAFGMTWGWEDIVAATPPGASTV